MFICTRIVDSVSVSMIFRFIFELFQWCDICLLLYYFYFFWGGSLFSLVFRIIFVLYQNEGRLSVNITTLTHSPLFSLKSKNTCLCLCSVHVYVHR
jgi:hypothetical protein